MQELHYFASLLVLLFLKWKMKITLSQDVRLNRNGYVSMQTGKQRK